MPVLSANQVTLAEVLQVKGSPLNEEEIWAVLSQASKAIEKILAKGRSCELKVFDLKIDVQIIIFFVRRWKEVWANFIYCITRIIDIIQSWRYCNHDSSLERYGALQFLKTAFYYSVILVVLCTCICRSYKASDLYTS